MIKFSIIIPCRDEEDHVKIILENIKKNCIHENYEIIFINDFSSDKTEENLKNLIIKYNHVSYFNNKKKGLGGAIELGLRESKGKYITILMADSSDSIDDLNKYVRIMDEGVYDAVFGSRFISGGKIYGYPIIKLFFNRVGNNLARIFFLRKYNDYTNPFKIYKREIVDHFYPIVSEDFNIFLELSLKTISRGFTYKIIPIKYYNRKVGTAKFKVKKLGPGYLFTLLYCFFEKILLNKKK
jgi:dolichol-phosphate mannosyltransferase